MTMKNLLPLFLLALGAGSAHAVSLIQLDFTGNMSDIERQTFVDAADFWNSAITGYLLTSDGNGNPTPHSLTITASIATLDGPGNILGSAGPVTADYYDNDPLTPHPTIALFYTTTGLIQFDAADVSALVANNTLYSAVLHEMGHVLGIGTLWLDNSNLKETNYPLYVTGSGQYTGPHALAQYQTEFSQPGATYVPVELEGGQGNANGHWNENFGGLTSTGIVSADNGMDFSQELMTGWSSGSYFLSRTTLGALEDLGYLVDYSKAGVIDHLVVVPETSTAALAFVAAGMFLRRKR